MPKLRIRSFQKRKMGIHVIICLTSQISMYPKPKYPDLETRQPMKKPWQVFLPYVMHSQMDAKTLEICLAGCGYARNLPVGSRRDDHTSSVIRSDGGGQLITGDTTFPESTGPSPLLRPATAINTVGIPSAMKKWRLATASLKAQATLLH